MPKINVYLPDELAEAVREAGVPVSQVCQRALEQAVRRITAVRRVVVTDLTLDDVIGRLVHFTDRARTAVRLAIEQARDSGAREVGTEHLLGGLLAEGGNLALQLLPALEIDPEQVRRELSRRTAEPGPAPESPAEPITGAGPDLPAGQAGRSLRFSSAAASALELTVTEATSFGHNYIGCEHLLLGLIVEPDGTAGHILRGMGAEQRMTRNAVAAALGGYRHSQDQAQAQDAGTTPRPAEAAALTAAIRRELEPLARRLDQVEERLAAISGK